VQWYFRLILVAAGFLLIDPGILTTLAGLGISALILFIHYLQYKKANMVVISG
jgi:UPF0716 family protein affecting phage T7 exclusion